MENPELHDAASKLAGSKGSWVPFTTPGVSAAARTLAETRNRRSSSKRGISRHVSSRASASKSSRGGRKSMGTRARASSSRGKSRGMRASARSRSRGVSATKRRSRSSR